MIGGADVTEKRTEQDSIANRVQQRHRKRRKTSAEVEAFLVDDFEPKYSHRYYDSSKRGLRFDQSSPSLWCINVAQEQGRFTKSLRTTGCDSYKKFMYKNAMHRLYPVKNSSDVDVKLDHAGTAREQQEVDEERRSDVKTALKYLLGKSVEERVKIDSIDPYVILEYED